MSKKLILDIDDELWANFKMVVPRSLTLHDAIVELINVFTKKVSSGSIDNWLMQNKEK